MTARFVLCVEGVDTRRALSGEGKVFFRGHDVIIIIIITMFMMLYYTRSFVACD